MKDCILFTLAVGMLAACLVGCTKASQIDYRRSGGFLGLDDHLVIKENGQSILTRKSKRYEFVLSSETVSYLQSLFEQAHFSELQKEYLPSRPGSDLFDYVVTYKGHTVHTKDGAVPSSLQPILEALSQVVQDHGQ